MNLGVKGGVDPIILADAMSVGTARCWSVTENNPNPVVAEEYGRRKGGGVGSSSPSSSSSASANGYRGGFASRLMRKDLMLALKEGREAGGGGGVYLPIGSAVSDLYGMVCQKDDMGDLDFGALSQFLEGKGGGDNGGGGDDDGEVR